ncbi:MAG: fumarylacetoacetate hydrolase family protein [Defluviicoccus sp.]|nr:fumarylacetoacetate hydrolase family protein [Defluviicoccus sp.]MDE0383709.1 fumarylacetoacetate hydrolase family protein [Defluviicoccus sp.]
MQLGVGLVQAPFLARQVVLAGEGCRWAPLADVFARAGLASAPAAAEASLSRWIGRIATLGHGEMRRLETVPADDPEIVDPGLVCPVDGGAKIMVVGGWSPVSRPDLAPREMTAHVMTRWMDAEDFERPPITAFKKFCSATADPGAALPLPILQLVHGAPTTGRFTADAALAVVIGKPALRVSRRDAPRHVAGITLMIDVWDDEVFLEESRVRRGMLARNLPRLSPVGPGIRLTGGAGIDDDFEVSFSINGVVRQRFRVADFAYGIAETIAFCSSMGLEPGDMLAFGARIAVADGTGPLDTPAAIAPGDSLEAAAEGIGTLAANVVAGEGWS